MRAAEHEHFLALPRFSLRGPLGGFATEDSGARPAGVLECPREDELWLSVHPPSNRRIVRLSELGRPVGGHQRVGDTPEGKCPRSVQLADRELIELFVHDGPVELTIGTGVKAVETGDYERCQAWHCWSPLRRCALGGLRRAVLQSETSSAVRHGQPSDDLDRPTAPTYRHLM